MASRGSGVPGGGARPGPRRIESARPAAVGTFRPPESDPARAASETEVSVFAGIRAAATEEQRSVYVYGPARQALGAHDARVLLMPGIASQWVDPLATIRLVEATAVRTVADRDFSGAFRRILTDALDPRRVLLVSLAPLAGEREVYKSAVSYRTGLSDGQELIDKDELVGRDRAMVAIYKDCAIQGVPYNVTMVRGRHNMPKPPHGTEYTAEQWRDLSWAVYNVLLVAGYAVRVNIERTNQSVPGWEELVIGDIGLDERDVVFVVMEVLKKERLKHRFRRVTFYFREMTDELMTELQTMGAWRSNSIEGQ